MYFRYEAAIGARFPAVSGGVIFVSGLRNGTTPAALAAQYQDEQQAVIAAIGDQPLSDIEPLAAWRAAFRAFDVNPTRYRSAVEALLRRLTKKGDIPHVNTLVDMCNLVSIRHRLPVAAFDSREIAGGITVRFADGSEQFTPLDAAEPEQPPVGEVVFSDEMGMAVARRWCWRQSAESAAQPDTTHAIITVEAQHDHNRRSVQAALDDLLALVSTHVGGQVTAGIVDAAQPGISDKE